jgi:hypothetical protein
MASARAVAPTFSEEQLGELLELIGDADSVELKLTVPDADRRSVAAALGIDPLDAQIRQVYFFDTPDLALNRSGIVLRARRVQRKDGDSVVKLRPVVPSALPTALRESPAFNVEVDAMPGGFVCSATLKRKAGTEEVRQVAAGARLSGLFSKQQLAFLSEHAPDDLALDDLSVLGPILVFKLKFEPEGLERRLVAELWWYPDDSRVLELSTKCAPKEAFLAAAETRVFLSQRGIDLSGEQQTKTLKALEFFSARLAEGGG